MNIANVQEGGLRLRNQTLDLTLFSKKSFTICVVMQLWLNRSMSIKTIMGNGAYDKPHTMLSMYGRCALKLAEIFFAKDGTAPEANRFNSFLRILGTQFHRNKKDKNKQKATRACLKVCRKTHENTWN